MKQYNVTGMSCAACSARVEQAVAKVEGVTACSVNLLTNSMGVEGTATEQAVISAVEAAGYGASLKSAGSRHRTSGGFDSLKDEETPVLKRRLLISLGFLCVLMYISMGHMMFGYPLPEFLEKNHIAVAILQMLFTIVIMVINQKFFINGFRGLFKKSPNMDTLVAIGASAAFGYSVYALFLMTDALVTGNHAKVMEWMHELYFESAAMILTLITLGKMLEARSKGKTTDALKGLMKLLPNTAIVIRDEKEVLVSVDEVQKGDIFIVRPGESIPVDGVVVDGGSAVDEAALTGESIPVDKEKGDSVFAATLNRSGIITCQATRIGEDTTLEQIIQMVSDAAATKAPIAKIADRVCGVFVPAVILIAMITLVTWLLAGYSVGFALARAICVLVISCPCALGLATPVAIMVGNGIGAKQGILFKTAASLEETGKVEIVALDKTGTITAGEPKVTDLYTAEGIRQEKLMEYACSLEKNSEHPLAKAVLEKAAEMGITAVRVDNFRILPGNGLEGKIQEKTVFGGNYKYVDSRIIIPDKVKRKAEQFAMEGKTPLFFAKDQQLLGIIAVADVIKEDSPGAVKELQNMGIRVVMLTGDNEKTAHAIGRQAGVDEVIAGVLPDGKEQVIRNLQREGKVAMVGDGINDAPALTRADMGIAIGAGADVAIDAADVVLVQSRLSDVPAAIRLSRATVRNIRQNLFWAFFYNCIGIPLAAGAFIAINGWKMNPMYGAAAMSLSSFCVVTNALRLNAVNIRNGKNDHKIKRKKQKECKTMEKCMKIEGMMCGHCEARVKKTLEALSQVEEAVVNHESGTAVVKLNGEISDDVLKETVEAQDYKVISVQ